jgi:murein DD-endopeptidase MepM/ murein hydrolase activator NlpD
MVVAAMENPHKAPRGASPALQRLLAQMADKPQKPVRKELVWSGSDIDGDGAPDFANPTGAAPRGHDDFGDGEFGARRDGGSRSHEGVDYTAQAGQNVRAPISGYVTKIGYAYSGSSDLRFVEITNPALGYVARAFYVDPGVEVGQSVRLGESIGSVESLQRHYPGITDHVHLEVMEPGGERVNAAQLIVPKLVAQA